jgi:anti-sigma regulatory factor (Ser/Thr protein kinase)
MMDIVAERAETFVSRDFGPHELEELAHSQLEHALDARRRGSKIYESLKSLNDIIGTQYGDRVLLELLQNAHDAHDADGQGEISIRLLVEDDACGELLIANRGHGFTASNLDAIRNSGVSDKEVGDGIGNKGLGFRSVGALTEDVRIYSQDGIGRSDRFWGYCFRFATTDEIEARLEPLGAPKAIRKEVASNIPRYLVPLPLREQPDEIMRFAHAGFATVVVLPLRSADAVQLALQQARPSGSTGGKDGGDKSVCEARINERHLREAQISLTFELSQ